MSIVQTRDRTESNASRFFQRSNSYRGHCDSKSKESTYLQHLHTVFNTSIRIKKSLKMSTSNNNFPLPTNLVAPVDDGACAHLTGLEFPSVPLLCATAKEAGNRDRKLLNNTTKEEKGGEEEVSTVEIDISKISRENNGSVIILFCYPRTGAPGETVPKEWDDIPGARGCTPQNCEHCQRVVFNSEYC